MNQEYETRDAIRHNGVPSAGEAAWAEAQHPADDLIERVRQLVDTSKVRRREDEEAQLLRALADRVVELTAVATQARDWIRSELDWIGGADAPEGSSLHADHVLLARLEHVIARSATQA